MRGSVHIKTTPHKTVIDPTRINSVDRLSQSSEGKDELPVLSRDSKSLQTKHF